MPPPNTGERASARRLGLLLVAASLASLAVSTAAGFSEVGRGLWGLSVLVVLAILIRLQRQADNWPPSGVMLAAYGATALGAVLIVVAWVWA